MKKMTPNEAIEWVRRALAAEEKAHKDTIVVIRSDGNHSHAVRVKLGGCQLKEHPYRSTR